MNKHKLDSCMWVYTKVQRIENHRSNGDKVGWLSHDGYVLK